MYAYARVPASIISPSVRTRHAKRSNPLKQSRRKRSVPPRYQTLTTAETIRNKNVTLSKKKKKLKRENARHPQQTIVLSRPQFARASTKLQLNYRFRTISRDFPRYRRGHELHLENIVNVPSTRDADFIQRVFMQNNSTAVPNNTPSTGERG